MMHEMGPAAQESVRHGFVGTESTYHFEPPVPLPTGVRGVATLEQLAALALAGPDTNKEAYNAAKVSVVAAIGQGRMIPGAIILNLNELLADKGYRVTVG